MRVSDAREFFLSFKPHTLMHVHFSRFYFYSWLMFFNTCEISMHIYELIFTELFQCMWAFYQHCEHTPFSYLLYLFMWKVNVSVLVMHQHAHILLPKSTFYFAWAFIPWEAVFFFSFSCVCILTHMHFHCMGVLFHLNKSNQFFLFNFQHTLVKFDLFISTIIS